MAYSSVGELKTITTINNPEIIALQETHLHQHHTFNPKNYTTYRHDFLGGNNACGGVAILVKNTVASHRIPLLTGNLQAIAISVSTPNLCFKNLVMCNIYIPPHQNITAEETDQIFNQLPSTHVVLGDFNAHSSTQGCNYTNNRGNIIDKFLTKSDTFLLNNGTHTHINLSTGSTSAIDLSLSLSNIAHFIEWGVHKDLFYSDYFPISISFQTQNQIKMQGKFLNWQTDKANLNLYKNLISQTLDLGTVHDPTFSNGNVDEIVDSFTRSIINAAKNNIPKSSTKICKKSVPWWCDELKIAIYERKKALRKFKKNDQ